MMMRTPSRINSTPSFSRSHGESELESNLVVLPWFGSAQLVFSSLSLLPNEMQQTFRIGDACNTYHMMSIRVFKKIYPCVSAELLRAAQHLHRPTGLCALSSGSIAAANHVFRL